MSPGSRHPFNLPSGLLELEMGKRFHSFLRNFLGFASMLAILGTASIVLAQQNGSPVPYASIGTKGASYAGPGREAAYDLAGPTIHIGLIAPLHGPQKADGEAIVTAAQMALQDASRHPLPGGRHLALTVADENVPPWGPLGDKIINLVVREKVIAIVTCADGVTAHLSEQIGNKIGVPVLTLSTDVTATQINMPWIFRLGPSDVQQAQVTAEDIYHVRDFQRVLLVADRDHDGRVGGQEFISAAHRLGLPPPASLPINPLQPDTDSLLASIKAKSPQAIVFWTQPENARKLLQAIWADGVHTPIYLSQQTAQEGSGLKFPPQNRAGEKDPAGAGIYTVASTQTETPLRESFVRRYRLATGVFPSPVAAEAYDAVQLIARAVLNTGPNRARVRDQVSSAKDFAGVSGTISFDDQGNNRTEVGLVRLQ